MPLLSLLAAVLFATRRCMSDIRRDGTWHPCLHRSNLRGRDGLLKVSVVDSVDAAWAREKLPDDEVKVPQDLDVKDDLDTKDNESRLGAQKEKEEWTESGLSEFAGLS